MQLNKFTDYALRVLIYVAPQTEAEPSATIAQIAQALHISENHLVKIVHFMAKQQWLITTRGRHGGISLHPQVLDLHLGDIIQTLEGGTAIVDCYQPQQCYLLPRCSLKNILHQAMQQFYQYLNQYKMAEVLQPSSPQKTNPLIELLSL